MNLAYLPAIVICLTVLTVCAVANERRKERDDLKILEAVLSLQPSACSDAIDKYVEQQLRYYLSPVALLSGLQRLERIGYLDSSPAYRAFFVTYSGENYFRSKQ